ncbi:hypothetical protein SLS56_009410 [Neofusicoccum ribis]|uniref:Uncharacterized protein n=1 Tax=Neofusicoccum ribis TaxID=45134 RepID=A0ABR3SI65_9PEZI
MPLLGLASSRQDDADEAAKYDHQIHLVDHTKSDDGDKSPSEPSSGAQTPLSQKPSRRLNRSSIREDLAKRGLARQKYAKWQQDRFQSFDEAGTSGETRLVQIDSKGAQLRSEETEQTDTSSKDEAPVSRQKSKLERGKKRVKGLVNSKKVIKQSKEEDAVVDVLYENQRGSFFFGIPLFSSKSLLNFDPAAWVDGRFKPTPMSTIMSLLVFQSSRRQLLSLLLRRFEAASAHREAHKDREQPESSPESRKINNLLNALHAADEECRRLEYWSDIREIAKRGDSVGAVDENHGWGHGWEGLDDSGPGETDEGGAERFKEDGKSTQPDSEKVSEEAENRPPNEKDAGPDADQPDEHEHRNGSKDKGKGKAEL